MKILNRVILSVLVFLAVSSGITKIMLMQQDVEFFGAYGFTDPILIIYGIMQLIGGVMLIFQKTRFLGALVVAITFLISAVVLFMAGKIPVAVITLVATALLGLVMRQNLSVNRTES